MAEQEIQEMLEWDVADDEGIIRARYSPEKLVTYHYQGTEDEILEAAAVDIANHA